MFVCLSASSPSNIIYYILLEFILCFSKADRLNTGMVRKVQLLEVNASSPSHLGELQAEILKVGGQAAVLSGCSLCSPSDARFSSSNGRKFAFTDVLEFLFLEEAVAVCSVYIALSGINSLTLATQYQGSDSIETKGLLQPIGLNRAILYFHPDGGTCIETLCSRYLRDIGTHYILDNRRFSMQELINMVLGKGASCGAPVGSIGSSYQGHGGLPLTSASVENSHLIRLRQGQGQGQGRSSSPLRRSLSESGVSAAFRANAIMGAAGAVVPSAQERKGASSSSSRAGGGRDGGVTVGGDSGSASRVGNVFTVSRSSNKLLRGHRFMAAAALDSGATALQQSSSTICLAGLKVSTHSNHQQQQGQGQGQQHPRSLKRKVLTLDPMRELVRASSRNKFTGLETLDPYADSCHSSSNLNSVGRDTPSSYFSGGASSVAGGATTPSEYLCEVLDSASELPASAGASAMGTRATAENGMAFIPSSGDNTRVLSFPLSTPSSLDTSTPALNSAKSRGESFTPIALPELAALPNHPAATETKSADTLEQQTEAPSTSTSARLKSIARRGSRRQKNSPSASPSDSIGKSQSEPSSVRSTRSISKLLSQQESQHQHVQLEDVQELPKPQQELQQDHREQELQLEQVQPAPKSSDITIDESNLEGSLEEAAARVGKFGEAEAEDAPNSQDPLSRTSTLSSCSSTESRTQPAVRLHKGFSAAAGAGCGGSSSSRSDRVPDSVPVRAGAAHIDSEKLEEVPDSEYQSATALAHSGGAVSGAYEDPFFYISATGFEDRIVDYNGNARVDIMEGQPGYLPQDGGERGTAALSSNSRVDSMAVASSQNSCPGSLSRNQPTPTPSRKSFFGGMISTIWGDPAAEESRDTSVFAQLKDDDDEEEEEDKEEDARSCSGVNNAAAQHGISPVCSLQQLASYSAEPLAATAGFCARASRLRSNSSSRLSIGSDDLKLSRDSSSASAPSLLHQTLPQSALSAINSGSVERSINSHSNESGSSRKRQCVQSTHMHSQSPQLPLQSQQSLRSTSGPQLQLQRCERPASSASQLQSSAPAGLFASVMHAATTAIQSIFSPPSQTDAPRGMLHRGAGAVSDGWGQGRGSDVQGVWHQDEEESESVHEGSTPQISEEVCMGEEDGEKEEGEEGDEVEETLYGDGDCTLEEQREQELSHPHTHTSRAAAASAALQQVASHSLQPNNSFAENERVQINLDAATDETAADAAVDDAIDASGDAEAEAQNSIVVDGADQPAPSPMGVIIASLQISSGGHSSTPLSEEHSTKLAHFVKSLRFSKVPSDVARVIHQCLLAKELSPVDAALVISHLISSGPDQAAQKTDLLQPAKISTRKGGKLASANIKANKVKTKRLSQQAISKEQPKVCKSENARQCHARDLKAISKLLKAFCKYRLGSEPLVVKTVCASCILLCVLQLQYFSCSSRRPDRITYEGIGGGKENHPSGCRKVELLPQPQEMDELTSLVEVACSRLAIAIDSAYVSDSDCQWLLSFTLPPIGGDKDSSCHAKLPSSTDTPPLSSTGIAKGATILHNEHSHDGSESFRSSEGRRSRMEWFVDAMKCRFAGRPGGVWPGVREALLQYDTQYQRLKISPVKAPPPAPGRRVTADDEPGSEQVYDNVDDTCLDSQSIGSPEGNAGAEVGIIAITGDEQHGCHRSTRGVGSTTAAGLGKKSLKRSTSIISRLAAKKQAESDKQAPDLFASTDQNRSVDIAECGGTAAATSVGAASAGALASSYSRRGSHSMQPPTRSNSIITTTRKRIIGHRVDMGVRKRVRVLAEPADTGSAAGAAVRLVNDTETNRSSEYYGRNGRGGGRLNRRDGDAHSVSAGGHSSGYRGSGSGSSIMSILGTPTPSASSLPERSVVGETPMPPPWNLRGYGEGGVNDPASSSSSRSQSIDRNRTIIASTPLDPPLAEYSSRSHFARRSNASYSRNYQHRRAQDRAIEAAAASSSTSHQSQQRKGGTLPTQSSDGLRSPLNVSGARSRSNSLMHALPLSFMDSPSTALALTPTLKQ